MIPEIPLMALLGAALAGALVVIGAMRTRLRALRDSHAAVMHMRTTAQDGEQTLVRRLRLAAHDLRGIGMTLHGHADQLTNSEHPHAAGIATAAADLMDMADDLQDHTVQAGPGRTLREEPVGLGLAIDEAITVVTAAIAPGRRHWRVDGDVRGTELRVDRRALRHTLTRVLADAVRSTRMDDFIDVTLHPREANLALVIADEGQGTINPGAGPSTPRDSRGIGLRLALARTLMEAHDGKLEIEAWAGVGTRVSLVFPNTRIIRRPALTGT